MASVVRRIGRTPSRDVVLAVVHAGVGISAVAGGIGLIRDGMGMPDEWLLSTPFDTWAVPGALLATGIGGSQLAAAALLAVHDPRGRKVSMAVGVGLAGWITVQVLVLRRYHPMQPTMFAVGVAQALAARGLPRRAAPGPSAPS